MNPRAILCFAAASALVFSATAQSSISDAIIDSCMQPVASQVPAWQAQGMSGDQIRKQLETALVRCRAPQTPGPAADFMGAINADLARASLRFLEGKLTYDAYKSILGDRNGKYARFQTDSAFRAAITSGDSDGDGIPDSLDRCPRTADLTPTDAQGCPVMVPPCSSPLGICTTGYDIGRALGDLKIMFNKSCDGALPPTTPSPLDWGRGRQTVSSIYGYNLLVSRVANQPQGCEVFYEVEFRFTGGPSGEPDPMYVTAMFSERESLTNDPNTVMLPLPFLLAISDTSARARLANGLGHYVGVSWRVRAMNGSSQYSLWSGIRVQSADPKGLGL